ncbi:MAG TPA: OmpA family protein [Kofleriaceae bacterium]|nr:OmpA family protein [Kofleriaceae bacterium]
MGKVFVAIAVITLALAAGCGSKPKPPGCKGDNDCKKPLVCATNKCVECRDDSQCPKGKKCSGNACVVKPACITDDQCPSGQVCQAGSCKPCAGDGECGPGGKCEAGACQRGKKCTKDEECADDEDCINGYCVRAGAGSNVDAGCTLNTVYFAFDDSTIQASERDRLDKNNACMSTNKDKAVLVIGHTDTSGTEEYNIALSERRAQQVADYLARLGSDPAKLQVVPKGETEPTGNGDDKDRRVEFKWR